MSITKEQFVEFLQDPDVQLALRDALLELALKNELNPIFVSGLPLPSQSQLHQS